MSDANPYAPPEAAVADVTTGAAAPALWNPAAAASWCLLFTPVFGAILQMRNWQALGEPARAARSRAWAIACAVLTAAIGLGGALSDLSPAADRALGLYGFALLLIWYFVDGRGQIRYVRARFGKTYPRRGWALPLLIALGAFVVYLVAMTAIAVAVMAAQQPF